LKLPIAFITAPTVNKHENWFGITFYIVTYRDIVSRKNLLIVLRCTTDENEE